MSLNKLWVLTILLGLSNSLYADLSVTSWNILAQAYVKPEYYPKTEARYLQQEYRHGALLDFMLRENTDALLLQEVDSETYRFLAKNLKSLVGIFGKETRKNKADGLAIFYKPDHLRHISHREIPLKKGKNALMGRFEYIATGKEIVLVTTKVSWVKEDLQFGDYIGSQQVAELLQTLAAHQSKTIVMGGDFNAVPGSRIPELMKNNGYFDAFAIDNLPTMHINHSKLQRIDYIFINKRLPMSTKNHDHLTADFGLPSKEWGSDHLPITLVIHEGSKK